jgi:hypothetical protein
MAESATKVAALKAAFGACSQYLTDKQYTALVENGLDSPSALRQAPEHVVRRILKLAGPVRFVMSWQMEELARLAAADDARQREPDVVLVDAVINETAQEFQVPSKDGGYIHVNTILTYLDNHGLELMLMSDGHTTCPPYKSNGWSVKQFNVAGGNPIKLTVQPKPGCRTATAYPTQQNLFGQIWQLVA